MFLVSICVDWNSIDTYWYFGILLVNMAQENIRVFLKNKLQG